MSDLSIKTKNPNQLASSLEKKAAAGAILPKNLHERITYLQYLTQLARPLLASLIGEIAAECRVVCVNDDKITLALPNMTAINHLRYQKADCLLVLHTHADFELFNDIGFVVSTKKVKSKHVSENHFA